MSVRFVSAERTWKTVYLTFFLEGKVCLALEDSKKSLGCMCFFNKVFIWTMYKKAFRLEGYVICFVSAYNA